MSNSLLPSSDRDPEPEEGPVRAPVRGPRRAILSVIPGARRPRRVYFVRTLGLVAAAVIVLGAFWLATTVRDYVSAGGPAIDQSASSFIPATTTTLLNAEGEQVRVMGTGGVPTTLPAGLVLVAPSSVTASSNEAGTDEISYSARNVSDGYLSSAWKEGAAGAGPGEWIKLNFSDLVEVRRIDIANGYQSTENSYKGNPRVKDIRVSFSDGTTREYQLADAPGFQQLTIPSITTSWVRISIVSVYQGALRESASIAEIKVFTGKASN